MHNQFWTIHYQSGTTRTSHDRAAMLCKTTAITQVHCREQKLFWNAEDHHELPQLSVSMSASQTSGEGIDSAHSTPFVMARLGPTMGDGAWAYTPTDSSSAQTGILWCNQLTIQTLLAPSQGIPSTFLFTSRCTHWQDSLSAFCWGKHIHLVWAWYNLSWWQYECKEAKRMPNGSMYRFGHLAPAAMDCTTRQSIAAGPMQVIPWFCIPFLSPASSKTAMWTLSSHLGTGGGRLIVQQQ